MNARSLTLGSLKAILALSALCVQVFTDAVDATALRKIEACLFHRPTTRKHAILCTA